MFGNPYARNFNNNLSQQGLYEQIDYEINNLQQMKEKMKNNNAQMQNQQQPSINQTFQLAPTNREVIRYANSIEDVQRDVVVGDTPYFSKDMSIVWVKSINGTIRSYELNEIVEKDAKDIQIEFLQAQINELKKGMIKDEQSNSNVTIEQDATNTTKFDEPTREQFEKKEPTSIQRVQTSKRKQ
jgi:hypothetical protein